MKMSALQLRDEETSMHAISFFAHKTNFST